MFKLQEKSMIIYGYIEDKNDELNLKLIFLYN